MKKKLMFLVSVCMLLILVGMAIANDMMGLVTGVDSKTGILTISHDKRDVEFECAAGVLPKDLEVDNRAKVQFNEVNGKKKATKVIKVPIGC